MPGMVTDINLYLKKSDVFIFPSLYEGFGNVLIEAQYLKLPIICSNIEPHKEAVCSVYHKYFFEPTNVIDALDKLNKLLEDININDFEKNIELAYCFSENFSIENMVNNLYNIYNI